MKITQKKFSVMQLTENREEYAVLEMLYVLGFNLSYIFHYDNNKPFKSVFLAIKAKDRMVQKENKRQFKRNLYIVLTLIFLTCILITMALR